MLRWTQTVTSTAIDLLEERVFREAGEAGLESHVTTFDQRATVLADVVLPITGVDCDSSREDMQNLSPKLNNLTAAAGYNLYYKHNHIM